jgi:hypothetical protein
MQNGYRIKFGMTNFVIPTKAGINRQSLFTNVTASVAWQSNYFIFLQIAALRS